MCVYRAFHDLNFVVDSLGILFCLFGLGFAFFCFSGRVLLCYLGLFWTPGVMWLHCLHPWSAGLGMCHHTQLWTPDNAERSPLLPSHRIFFKIIIWKPKGARMESRLYMMVNYSRNCVARAGYQPAPVSYQGGVSIINFRRNWEN